VRRDRGVLFVRPVWRLGGPRGSPTGLLDPDEPSDIALLAERKQREELKLPVVLEGMTMRAERHDVQRVFGAKPGVYARPRDDMGGL